MPLCPKPAPLPQCLCGDVQAETNSLIETVMVILMAIGLLVVIRFLVNNLLDKVMSYITCNFSNLSMSSMSQTKNCLAPAPEPPSVSKCESKSSVTKPEPASPKLKPEIEQPKTPSCE